MLSNGSEKNKYYLVLLGNMESITIKVEDDFLQEIELAMRPYYSTKTEFIREAIRDKIKKMKVENELLSSFGKSKKKTISTDERRIREEVGKEFIKKYGLD
jgi:metal-responsive CopG/Arc/MetJ family transcriptional regulator